MHMIDNLKRNYSHVFDFEDNFNVGDYSFDLYAKYHQRNTKYFGSKKIEIYSFDNNEYVFVKDLGDNDIDFNSLKDFYTYIYRDFVEVDDNHMSSIITVIYALDNIDDTTKKKIKKFSFYKSYMFGLKGFVNGKLIVVDRTNNQAYENKLAKGDAAKLKLLTY